MTSLSTYDFSTLYTTLPHILIKDKLIDPIEKKPSIEKVLLTLHVMSKTHVYFRKKYHAWSCQNVRDALAFLLDYISI